MTSPLTLHSENEPRVAAVLLAAGESTRMHEMKALLPWLGGRTLLAHQAHALAAAGYEPIVVVLGHLSERLRQELTGPEPMQIVENPRYREGRTTSITAGLAVVPDDVEGVLIVSVDQPRSGALLSRLREAWLASRPAIAVPSLDGNAGHPPLFDTALLSELRGITEEGQGLREVVTRHRGERMLVPVDDPLTLTNLNTREQYEAALRLAQA